MANPVLLLESCPSTCNSFPRSPFEVQRDDLIFDLMVKFLVIGNDDAHLFLHNSVTGEFRYFRLDVSEERCRQVCHRIAKWIFSHEDPNQDLTVDIVSRVVIPPEAYILSFDECLRYVGRKLLND
jgi:hypothetical protein